MGETGHRPVVSPASGSRLAGIEGLRAIAASSIVVFHCWRYSSPEGGPVDLGDTGSMIAMNLSLGVTLFFCLSGFLLYRPFAAAIARGDPLPSIRAYLRNRALRIAPAYWAILAATALVLASVRVREPGGQLGFGAITDPAVLGQCVMLLQNYHPSTVGVGIGPAWSLAIEIAFYCALPVMVVAVAALASGRDRRGRVLALMAPPLLLLLLGLSGKYVAAVVVAADPRAGWAQDWHSVIERGFLAQADLFAPGMLVAVLRTEVVDGRLRLPRGWRASVLILAALLIVPSALTFDGAQLSYLPQNTLVAAGLALALMAVVVIEPAGRPSRIVGLLEAWPLTAVGVASYSLFLWHEPVQVWLRDHGLTAAGHAGLALNLIVLATVAGVLSALSYRFIEAPALRRKRRSTAAAEPATVPHLRPAASATEA